MKIEKRGISEMKKINMDRSNDVWCDECDSYVGKFFEIDSNQRLLCLECWENAQSNRVNATAQRAYVQAVQVLRVSVGPSSG